MPSRPLKQYRLTPAAQQDIDNIWSHTAEARSPKQASAHLRGLTETLNMLLQHPLPGKERKEISPSVRIHLHASHLIAYRVMNDHICIIRALHAHRSRQTLLAD